jgi:5-methylcytosine-specific restriction endonuclease McrA
LRRDAGVVPARAREVGVFPTANRTRLRRVGWLTASAGVTVPSAGRATTTRNIPSAVKRQVFTRDNGQCTYRDDRGRRCTSRSFIEFHHRQNFAWGGTHEPANLELRCRVHNAYQAELDYGRDFIERARRLG